MSRTRKRIEDDEEEAFDDSGDASSSKNKRKRREPLSSIGNGHLESASPDEAAIKSDDDDEEHDQVEPDAPAPSFGKPKVKGREQAEGALHSDVASNANRSASFDEEEEEGLEEEGDDDEGSDDDVQVRSAQNWQASHGKNVAEMGVIEKVELTNFMCHNRLTVSLGPQTNFIIGHNGSGKSAILTGITIALGGNALSTDRGKSLKSFVKEGKTGAIVELTLKNRGSEAFKPEEYGRSIIIERRINADGGGGWKIKSAKGRVVSTKRDELNALCDHANIQVDNPLNVLSQDQARQFLSDSRTSEKYHFFLRGTQLTQLAHEYSVIQSNIEKIAVVVKQKEEVVPDLKNAAAEAIARYEAVKKQREQHARLAEIKDLIVWAKVAEKERRLEQAVHALIDGEKRLGKQEAKLQEAQNALEQANNEISDLEALLNEDKDREAPLVEQVKRLREQMKSHRADMKGVKAQEQQLNDQFSRQTAVIEDLQVRIEREAQRMSDGNRAKRKELAHTLQEAEDGRKETERRQVELNDELRQLQQTIGAAAQRETEAKGRQDALRRQVDEAAYLCQRLGQARGNRMVAYGANVPALVRAIEAEKRWRVRPVGPIGLHLKLKDMSWAPVLESVIGNTLNAFCVTNHADRQLLEQIKQRTGNATIPTLTMRDTAIDFSSGESDPDVRTILRVLDIDNDFVLHQLVNAVHIERSALVERRVDGDALMRSGKRNVHVCFSKDMFRISGGQKGSSTQTLNAHTGPMRLSANVEAQLSIAKKKQAEVDQQLQQANAELRTAVDELKKLEARRVAIKREIPTLAKQARKHAEDEQRISDQMREDQPSSVAALEQAKEEAKEQLENIKQEFSTVQVRKEGIEGQLQPLEEEMDAAKSKLEEFEEERRSTMPRMTATVQGRVVAQKNMQHWEKEIRVQKGNNERLSEASLQVQEQVDVLTAQASEVAPDRPEIELTADEYIRQADALEKNLERARRETGHSVESVIADVNAAKRALESAQSELADFKLAVKHLSAAITLRQETWTSFRRSIASRARGLFTHHLAMRGYTGSLDFDHKGEKLHLLVQTEDSTQKRDKDPKSLSGGEKSFSTICLLLSLWEAIGCPIRCLDEFDVFMDAVNRKISMKMMIDAAKSTQGVQYILISPQSMASVTLGESTRVIKLQDPERNQTTLT
ncbi:P-loop containing nucleoside triphosphate hydrolase protein [Ceraceosorus guamensis]|uniref:P-loop containing nucleoside triphosphate hydrolase protein n=1 Tax=Ceraceosorus guamensis TaxID=1522189 RepID=A0A316W6A4_9BASI|nr:P-loop containing nucleoside triphosphate hydrolase protein [Ceraceosorus guamensis]PWN43573.1 P-loop containing nucleoside triphosphate hydrolase protein [Ceraceosorus guamensis]